eukprot:GGOE01020730.1.p1 GENE.GGOE01020730.1~~GGOE01020730.1.p1  ORF type:complete len:544 (+),score=203.18 GGOE01020730.1:75-1706(+)
MMSSREDVPLLSMKQQSSPGVVTKHSSSFVLGSRTYGFIPESKFVANWDTEEVCAWLDTNEDLEWLRVDRRDMSAVLTSFREQDINGVALLKLTDADLRELGVDTIGHRKQLLATIQALHRIGLGTVLMETMLPSGSVAGATFNLCSAVIGAGALSLPYAFAKAGVLLTMALLILAAVATVHTIRLLIFVFENSCTRTFEDSIEGLAGPHVAAAVEVLSILFCFGCAVAYIVVLGDSLTALLRWCQLDLQPLWPTLGVAFFCLLPPSCFRHIDALRVGSLLGMAAISYVVWTTVTVALGSTSESLLPPRQEPELVHLDITTCAAMPIVLFAYSCQVNVWPIYDELKAGEDIGKRKTMMMTASYFSILFSLVAYTVVGYFGYYSFGQNVQGNIIKNFGTEDASYTSLCMIISVFAAFPMNFFPLRQAINQLLYKRNASKLAMRNGRMYPVLRDPTAHFLQTFSLVAAIVLLGIFVPRLNFVFQLIGSLVSSTLCFILPAYLAILVELRTDPSLSRVLSHHLGAVALIVFGVSVAVLGTAVTILF